ncbi:lipopolysaccharide biosynthesis protein [Massilia sp. CT11-137]|uniref:lipopolysaccharide biosynthesis protein n=1 Tax=Massilia sp. CT11-137 TaxID=3393901 RepID=UPI0039A6AE4E
MKPFKKLGGNAGIYLGANVLNAGVPFLLLPLLTRILSPADYGAIAMFAIVLSIMGAFTGLSVHGAISVRYFQMEKERLAEYVGACMAILAVSTALVFITVLLCAQPVTELSGLPLDWVLVAIVLSGLQFIANIRLVLYQVSGQANRYGAFQIGQTVLNATLSLILVLSVGLAWQGRLIGQATAVALFGVAAAYLLYKDGLLLRPHNLKLLAGDALRFGVPMIPHTLGALLIVAVDRIVITKVLGLATAGIYMVALQMGQVVGLLTDSFNKAYAPWLMKRLADKDNVPRRAIVRGTYVYFVVVVSVALAIGAAAPWFLPLLVGNSFAPAAQLIIYTTLGFAFSGCYYMVTNYIFFESKTALLAMVTAVVGLLNVPLTIELVKANGAAGAGMAFMLTQFASFAGTWWLAHRTHPMPWLRAIVGTA